MSLVTGARITSLAYEWLNAVEAIDRFLKGEKDFRIAFIVVQVDDDFRDAGNQ